MTELKLHSLSHPSSEAELLFDQLVGLETQKATLIDELTLLLNPSSFTDWLDQHHPAGLPGFRGLKRTPLILLVGEVGCGKTALARSIGTPLAKALDRKVVSFETPSDLRGGGLVGELSARITAAFRLAKEGIPRRGVGLLIIDEADDIATRRSQAQAHHEDRAGLNALLKQLNQVDESLAVLMITNRPSVLDPALARRAAVQIPFTRPDQRARMALFQHLVGELMTDKELAKMAAQTDGHTFSDISHRVLAASVRKAWRENRALLAADLLAAIESTPPSPTLEEM